MAAEYPVLLSAVTITTGTNDTIIINDGSDRTATLTAGTFYLRGDGTASDLLENIGDAIDAATALTVNSKTIALDHDADNQSATVTFTLSGAWTLKGTGTFDLALIGIDESLLPIASSSDAIATTKSAQVAWVATQPYVRKEPEPERSVVQHEAPEGQTYTFTAGNTLVPRSLDMALIEVERVLREGNTSDPQASLQAWWELANDGRRVELHTAAVSSGTTLAALSTSTLVDELVLNEDTCRKLPASLTHMGLSLYKAMLRFREYVA